jgi:hypothetical protein
MGLSITFEKGGTSMGTQKKPALSRDCKVPPLETTNGVVRLDTPVRSGKGICAEGGHGHRNRSARLTLTA